MGKSKGLHFTFAEHHRATRYILFLLIWNKREEPENQIYLMTALFTNHRQMWFLYLC